MAYASRFLELDTSPASSLPNIFLRSLGPITPNSGHVPPKSVEEVPLSELFLEHLGALPSNA